MKDSRSLGAVLPTRANDHRDRSANKQIEDSFPHTLEQAELLTEMSNDAHGDKGM